MVSQTSKPHEERQALTDLATKGNVEGFKTRLTSLYRDHNRDMLQTREYNREQTNRRQKILEEMPETLQFHILQNFQMLTYPGTGDTPASDLAKVGSPKVKFYICSNGKTYDRYRDKEGRAPLDILALYGSEETKLYLMNIFKNDPILTDARCVPPGEKLKTGESPPTTLLHELVGLPDDINYGNKDFVIMLLDKFPLYGKTDPLVTTKSDSMGSVLDYIKENAERAEIKQAIARREQRLAEAEHKAV